MKGIGFIFLIFGFGVLSLFGQAEVADPENIETIEESGTVEEKTQRVFKVVNDYELAPDAAITTLVIIAGDARLHGRVTGNILVIGGDVKLESDAAVNGTLHLIGGQVAGNIERIAHLQVSNRWQIVPAVVKLLMHPYSSIWATDKGTGFQFTIVQFVVLLIMYLLIVAVFPKPVNAVRTLLTHRPIASILFSLLMLAVIPLILSVTDRFNRWRSIYVAGVVAPITVSNLR